MIHPTAKVSEQVNRKCSPRYTILQLSTPTPTMSPQTPTLKCKKNYTQTIVCSHTVWKRMHVLWRTLAHMWITWYCLCYL